jgi:glutaredoxin-related protein
MKPISKASGTKRLNLTCDKLHSSFAFKLYLRRYMKSFSDWPTIPQVYYKAG